VCGPVEGKDPEITHACVAYGDRIIHDPNRAREGIKEITHRWFLVPTNWPHNLRPVSNVPWRWWKDWLFLVAVGLGASALLALMIALAG